MIDNENEVLEAPLVDVEAPADAEAPVVDAAEPKPERSEVETRARAMGWVEKDQFRGPADQWRDADEFVKRGEEETPILRERNRDLARKHAELEERLARQQREFDERVTRQERMAQQALRKQREQMLGSYENAKRQAVELGDTQRYDQLDRDQREAVQQFDQQYYEAVTPKADPQQQVQQLPPHEKVEVDSWVQQNPWFQADPLMKQYAEAYHVHLNQTNPSMGLRENLAAVSQEVRRRFSDRFQPQRRPTAVEGGEGMATGGKRARGVAELPPEARRAAQEFVAAGAYKNVAEYAKDYWAQDGA